MQLLARASAFALMLALGQYIMVGSGFGCRASSHADSAPRAAAAAMSLHGVPEHNADCSAVPGSTRCPLDDMVCSSMAVCGAVVMTAGVRQTAAADGLTRVVPLLAIADVATRSIAPEPPPPRA